MRPLNKAHTASCKGQYSPTSETGKKERAKSSPAGSIDYPFNPVSLALGAEATFDLARTLDMDRHHTTAILKAAHAHRGSALIEIYQNCNVFNDKAFIQLTGKKERAINFAVRSSHAPSDIVPLRPIDCSSASIS